MIMHTDMKLLSTLCAIVFCASAMQAQQGTNAAGGEAASSAGAVSFSVGQVFYNAFENQKGISVSAGVQQTYEILTGNDETAARLNMNLVVFPNPTLNLITLRLDRLPDESLQYHLVDNSGKTLLLKPINSTDSFIDMSHWAAAVYHLRIMSKDGLVQSFKIIKSS